jgi:para-nitrobenzyl esterase
MEDHAHGNPRVTVSGGVLQGSIELGSGVRSFKGIPFAASPVGELRWRPPQPAAPWAYALPISSGRAPCSSPSSAI